MFRCYTANTGNEKGAKRRPGKQGSLPHSGLAFFKLSLSCVDYVPNERGQCGR